VRLVKDVERRILGLEDIDELSVGRPGSLDEKDSVGELGGREIWWSRGTERKNEVSG
jgi:hypothetical protein